MAQKFRSSSPAPHKYVAFLAWLVSVCWLVPQLAQAKEVHIVYSSITASQSVAWVAQEAGIRQKHGLNVQLVYVSSGSRAMSALLAGETPILFSAGNPGVSAALGGGAERLAAMQSNAVQTVLQTIGESPPAALKAKPEQFVDHSLLQKIERSGFVEKLYGG